MKKTKGKEIRETKELLEVNTRAERQRCQGRLEKNPREGDARPCEEHSNS